MKLAALKAYLFKSRGTNIKGRHHFWRMLEFQFKEDYRETHCILFHIDSIELDHDFLDENTTYFPKFLLVFVLILHTNYS